MQESSSVASAEQGIAAYVGIDWADQKHDFTLRSAAEPANTLPITGGWF